MKEARSVIDKVSETFGNFHTHAFSMVSLSEQWRKLQSDFSAVEASMASREEEVKSKEREIQCAEKRVEKLKKEVELQMKKVESEECLLKEKMREVELKKRKMDESRLLLEKREKEIVGRNRVLEERERLTVSFEEFEVKEKEIEERRKEVELKEKAVEERRKEVEMKEKEVKEGFLECRKTLETKKDELIEDRKVLVEQEKKLNEQCDLLEAKLEEVSKESEMLELKEKKLRDGLKGLELKEKEVEERFRKARLKEKEASEMCNEVELLKKKVDAKEVELDSRCSGLELREQAIEASCRAHELNEKKLDEQSRSLKLKEKECDEFRRSLEEKEKELKEGYEALELNVKKIDEQSRSLELNEKKIDEQNRGLELKEKECDEFRQSLEEIEKELKEAFQALELKEKQVDEKLREMKLKEKEIDDRCEAVQVEEKQVIRRDRELDLREQRINEGCRAKESEGKQIRENFTFAELEEKPSVELLEKQLNDANKVQANVTSNTDLMVRKNGNNDAEIVRLCVAMDGEGLRMFLNERFSEHESMREEICNALKLSKDPAKLVLSAVDGFFLPCLANDASATRKSCVLLLELMMNIQPSISEVVAEEAVKVANEWREKMRAEGESEIVVLGFLLLLVAYNLWQNFDVEELQRLYNVVDQHTVAPQLCLRLGFSRTKDGSCTWGQAQAGVILQDTFLATSAVASLSICLSDDIKLLCRDMNAKGLGLYLIEHINDYDMVNDKILDSLRLASDPAKLVLNVIHSFDELKLKEVLVGKFMAGCTLLLVHLMKLSTHISSHVKDEARKYADVWRFLLKQSNVPSEYFGLLQYLASFKLANTHDADELLSLFVTLCDESEVYQPEKMSSLCDALGLRSKMTDFIRSLLLDDKQLQAVRYICVLKMKDAVPVVPLLKGHLKNTQNRVEEILKMGSRTAQDDAANLELSALKEVLKCIFNYKLESFYSPDSLELRIKLLEKEREERKSTAHLPTIKRCSDIKDCVEEKAETSTPAILSNIQSEKKRPLNSNVSPREEKRPRVHTHHGVTPYNPSHSNRQPAYMGPHGYPVWQHQYLPPVGWANYHWGAPRAMYGVPYNTRTGDYGVPGFYRVGTSTSVYDARNPAHITAPRDSDCIKIHENGNPR